MTNPISPTAAAAAPVMTVAAAMGAANPTASGAAATGTDAMGSDTFLKLLVAQLKYQDPTKPADGTALLGQTAQFQMVEKLQQLADQNTQLLSAQQTVSAVALVGRTVTYTDGERTATGVVGSVRLSTAGPLLTVGAAEVPLHAVTDVRSAG